MAQWIALAITVGSVLVGFAVLWGAMEERMKTQAIRISKLEDQSQTEGEREAIDQLLDNRFKAHEAIDERRENETKDRFYLLQQTINAQFTDIMNELKRRL